MKKIMLLLVACFTLMAATAQPNDRPGKPEDRPGDRPDGPGRPEKFSPKKFEAELEQFIVKEACLTPSESAKFFPLYKEMRNKQRVVFDKQRRIDRSNPTTDAACRKAIKESDALEIESKQIQQTYHKKFMTVLSPTKVFKVNKAINGFHRRMLRHDGAKGGDKPGKKGGNSKNSKR